LEFDRSKYYSQTEVIKKYNIRVKKYKTLLQEKNIPVFRREIQLEGYITNTIYVLITDIRKLQLQER
jgi:hypothetical protein